MSFIRLSFALACLLAITACNENSQITEPEATGIAEKEMATEVLPRETDMPSTDLPREIAIEAGETEASIAVAAAMTEAELNDDAIREAYENQARLEQATDAN